MTTLTREIAPFLSIAVLVPVVLLPVQALAVIAALGIVTALLVAVADWAARDSLGHRAPAADPLDREPVSLVR